MVYTSQHFVGSCSEPCLFVIQTCSGMLLWISQDGKDQEGQRERNKGRSRVRQYWPHEGHEKQGRDLHALDPCLLFVFVASSFSFRLLLYAPPSPHFPSWSTTAVSVSVSESDCDCDCDCDYGTIPKNEKLKEADPSGKYASLQIKKRTCCYQERN